MTDETARRVADATARGLTALIMAAAWVGLLLAFGALFGTGGPDWFTVGFAYFFGWLAGPGKRPR